MTHCYSFSFICTCQEFYDLIGQYKFVLSFENAVCEGYMTEKLFRPLEAGYVYMLTHLHIMCAHLIHTTLQVCACVHGRT